MVGALRKISDCQSVFGSVSGLAKTTPVLLFTDQSLTNFAKSSGVEQMVAVRHALAAAVRIEREHRPRRLPVLRRDDDDAVRAARAVDRRRRRVLQDLDRLDVRRVERGQRIRRNRRRRVTTAVARVLQVRRCSRSGSRR